MTPRDPSSRNASFFGACIVALLGFGVVYSTSLRNAFHFDDVHVVVENPFVRDLANVPRFFTDARTFSNLPQNAIYRPVVTLTLALDHWVGGGLEPLAFHLTQLLLFAALGAAIVLLYLKLYDSTGQATWHRWAALFAATLFGVHTANSQVGNYISARSELLAALGVVSAFLVYLYVPRSRRYHLYLFPVVVGALAKNHAVVFAPLFLAYKLFIEGQRPLRALLTPREWRGLWPVFRSVIPAFALSIALFVWIEAMAPEGQTYGGGGRLLYLATSAWVWLRYAGLYFLPVGLTADTDLRLFTTFTNPRTLAGLLLPVASVVLIWRASNTPRWRPVAFGLAWFWIAIAPTSSVVPLAEVTNDHRPFLAFIGFNAAVVWVVFTSAHRLLGDAWAARRGVRTVTAGVAIAVLVAHGIATFQRNKVWRDDESLWADVVRKSPANGRGLMNYGLVKMRRGQLTEAKDLFARAKTFNPNYSFLEVNLGVVNNALHEPEIAERHFLRAVELDPAQPGVYFFYARFLVGRGRGPEAITHLQRSIALSIGRMDSRYLLMALYAARGVPGEAASLARETLQLLPSDGIARVYADGGIPLVPSRDDAGGWFALGLSHTQGERHLEAAQAYRGAVQRDANHADAWNNLGWTLGKLGFFNEAVVPLERAVALRPGNALARNNLAWVRAEAARRGIP